MTPAEIVAALAASCGFDKPAGEEQAKAIRRFALRVADFLARCPQEATAGEIAQALVAPPAP